jgi:hypothetical protein
MSTDRISIFARMAIVIVFAMNILGCVPSIEQMPPTSTSSNSQLSDFILGEWLSIQVNDVKPSVSESLDLRYKIVFGTDYQVKLIVIYPDGNTEGGTFTYNFISQDSVYIDNKRITGGEVWLLEKSGSSLIVTRSFDNISTRIVLEKIK